jgi:hypothetical protein
MRKMRRSRYFGGIGLALALTVLSGCQTWYGGATLPSPHYLEHPPQYIPPSPTFPLTRELATMETQGAIGPAAIGPGAVAPVPPPVPPAPVAPPPVP